MTAHEPHRQPPPAGYDPRPAPAGPVEPLVPPTETPPVEGSVAEAHQERADGGVWEHPGVWLGLIAVGAVLFAAFFVARIWGF